MMFIPPPNHSSAIFHKNAISITLLPLLTFLSPLQWGRRQDRLKDVDRKTSTDDLDRKTSTKQIERRRQKDFERETWTRQIERFQPTANCLCINGSVATPYDRPSWFHCLLESVLQMLSLLVEILTYSCNIGSASVREIIRAVGGILTFLQLLNCLITAVH